MENDDYRPKQRRGSVLQENLVLKFDDWVGRLWPMLQTRHNPMAVSSVRQRSSQKREQPFADESESQKRSMSNVKKDLLEKRG